MLIGIDASRATANRRTGTENYSLHLIRALLALDEAWAFRLYFRSSPDPALFPPTAGHRIIPFPRMWTHIRLSWEMATAPPDVLFVPSHVLPLIHPPRSVVTVHDLGYHYYPEAHTLFQNLYLRWSTRFNARSAARVLVDSEATRRDLMSYYGIPAPKIVVVYPGRDERMSPVTQPDIVAKVRARYSLVGPYLLYVGTLHPRKNLVRLVQAFGSLIAADQQSADRADGKAASALTDLKLVLAGQKGWLYAEVLAEVRKLGLDDRVILTGYVPDEDLPALLSNALAFVYPSLYEGFGLPVLEAMACGIPVVCANSSSLPEVAGDAALLVDPLDVTDITQGLFRIVRDETLRNRLVQCGYEQIAKFSWQRCARETIQILEDVGRGVD